MSQIFTQAAVNKLSTSTRKLVADGGCRGLYIDVRPNGSTYRFRFTDAERQQRNLKIGDASLLKLSEARQMAHTLARRLALGENIRPQKETGEDKSTSITFGEFIEKRYLPHVYLTRRNYKSEISALNKHILPVFGSKPLQEIRKGDIIEFFHAKSQQNFAPATTNRFLHHLQAIFSRAIEWEIEGIEKNPAKGIKPLPNHSRHERYLNSEEAQRLIAAVQGSKNKLLGPIIAFLLLTGCRKREVLDARWENIDFDRAILIIPLSKNGKTRHVPLSLGARTVLLQARNYQRQQLGSVADTCPWVFANIDTGKPFASIDNGWQNARAAAGLEDLRIHDLRHSFASALVNSGMTLYDVKEALGHASIQTTQRYAHLAPQRLMKAVSSAQTHYQLPGLVELSPTDIG